MEPYEPIELPIGDIDWESHVSLIGKANRSLARYDGILQAIINPDLLLSPLMTREAVLSSKIEGTQVSLEDVLQYEADNKEQFRPNQVLDIHEVINYRAAMNYAIDELKTRPLTINLIKELHRILLSSVRGYDREPGEIRRIQNFIGSPTGKIENARFVPPLPPRVPDALSNWEFYLHTDEKDPLVQLAILKAQFEIIHPFRDGNGRIGRMLVPLILSYKKTISSPMFYVSAYFERNRDMYYERLLSITRDNDWNGWISYFLEAIIEQSNENSKKAKAILDLYEQMKKDVPAITHSQYSTKSIDAIFLQPIFSTPNFVAKTDINKVTAHKILSDLTKKDILRVTVPGKARRSTIYSFPRLLEITESQKDTENVH